MSFLSDSFPPGSTKVRFEQLKTDIQNLADAADLATSPFTFEAAGRAVTELGFVLAAWDAALDKIADKLAEQEPAGHNHDANVASQKAAIKGIDEPWKKPFRGLAAALTTKFDAFCKAVLGTDNASADIADRLEWSRPDKKISLKLAAAGARSLGPLSLDGASVEAFFGYLTVATFGVTLKSKLKVGLRNDKLLEKIIPGEGASRLAFDGATR